MPELIPGAPAAIAAALERLKVELTAAAGENLAGLILYGGLARGRFRHGKSDVNVAVLLRDASGPKLTAITPALQSARRSAGVDPLVLTPPEVPRAGQAFPTKFLDIKHHHIVLAGADPFAGLEVSQEQARLRVEQELRNLLLRLRRRYVTVGSDQRMLTQALMRVARPLALGLQGLLQVAGKEAPDRSAAIFEAAAAAFGLEQEPLTRLAELRQDSQAIGDATTLYQGVLAAVTRAAEAAEQMKGGGS